MTFTITRTEGTLSGAVCDQCREPINARTETALTKATRAHRCPARPARTTP